MRSEITLNLVLGTTYSSCQDNTHSTEGPCMVYELSIAELEKPIDALHQ